jgi:hypothetical protein
MFDITNTQAEVELVKLAEELCELGELQLTLIGGGSGIAQLD